MRERKERSVLLSIHFRLRSRLGFVHVHEVVGLFWLHDSNVERFAANKDLEHDLGDLET